MSGEDRKLGGDEGMEGWELRERERGRVGGRDGSEGGRERGREGGEGRGEREGGYRESGQRE